MNSLFSLYQKALFWNIQSALLYKLLLITHQTCLFAIVPHIIFGQAGTLFASLFFFVAITNFGFDYSLITLFAQKQKNNSGISLQQYILYKIIIAVLSGIVLWYAYYTFHIPYLVFLFQNVSPFLFDAYISLYITENIKKTLALHADLSFQNKQHFFIEIGCLVGYIITVWGLYFYNHTIDILTLLLPFSAWSFIECTLLFLFVLKATRHDVPHTQQTFRLSQDQSINYLTQLIKTIYSPNSIFMFLSWHFGFAKVGIIKLLLDSLSFLHTFLYRTIGTPLAALYSRDQNVPGLRQALNSYLYIVATIYIFLCASIIASEHLITSEYWHSELPIWTILCIIGISFLEYLQIPHDKILLVHNQAFTVFISYSSAFIFGFTWYMLYLTQLLPSILVSRLIIFICIQIAVKKNLPS